MKVRYLWGKSFRVRVVRRSVITAGVFLCLAAMARGQVTTYTVPQNVVETTTDHLTGTGEVVKAGIGTVWLTPLGETNIYSGRTTILDGVLRAEDGVGLPTASTLFLNGANINTRAAGVLETRGTFSRSIGLGAGQVYWNGTYGGFAARGGDLLVELNGGSPLLWAGTTNGFNARSLSFGSFTADGVVDLRNDIGLGATRLVAVTDNPSNGNDIAVMSGEISNGSASSFGLTKAGDGTLWLKGTNTFSGTLAISAGAVRAEEGAGLPTASPVTLYGTYGILEARGVLNKNIGTGAGQIAWSAANGGGFAAAGGPLTVTLNGGADVAWANTSVGFAARVLALNSRTADDVVTLVNPIEMGAARTIFVYDNPFSNADYARLTGDLRGNNTGWNLTKAGDGVLELAGFNSYRGNTLVTLGTLRVNGSIASNNYMDVSAPAAIAGTGTVVFAHANGLRCWGTAAPGDQGVGTLAMTGNATFYSGSKYEMELGPAAARDLLTFSGNLAIQPTFTVVLADAGGDCAAFDELTILTYGGVCTAFPTNAWAIDDSRVRHSARWNTNGVTLVHDPVGKRIYVTGLAVERFAPETWISWDGGNGGWTDANWSGTLEYPDRTAEAQINSAGATITVTGNQEAHTLSLTNGTVRVDDGAALQVYFAHVAMGEIEADGSLNGADRIRIDESGSLRVAGSVQAADLQAMGTNTLESGASLNLGQWTYRLPLDVGSGVVVRAESANVSPGLTVAGGGSVSAAVWTVRGPVDVAAAGAAAGLVRLGDDADMTIRGGAAGRAQMVFEGGTLRAADATRVGGLDFTLGGVLDRRGAAASLAVVGPFVVSGFNVDLDALMIDPAGADITATNGYWLSTTGNLNAVSLTTQGDVLRVGGTLSVSNKLAFEDVTVTNPVTGDAMVVIGENRTRDTLVWFAATNTYTGKTQIERGTLRAVPGTGLPDGAQAGYLEFSGDTVGWHAMLESSGAFERNIGTGNREVYWDNHGGFGAVDGDLEVRLNGGAALTWGAAGGFNAKQLYLNTTSATHMVTLHNAILVDGDRYARVFDNWRTNTDVARIAGEITMDTTARIFRKEADGTLWLTGTNTYGGRTVIEDGVLRAVDGVGLSPASVLYLSGNGQTVRASGVLESSGAFTRDIGTAAGRVYWETPGGFSAQGGPLNVNLQGGATILWNSATAGFNNQALVSGGQTADDVATIENPIDLIANRLIYVWDNTNSMNDALKLSGTIANGGAGNFSVYKNGSGVLWLTGTNTFSGGVSNYGGVVRYEEGVGIPAAVAIAMAQGTDVYPCALETAGTFNRTIGDEPGGIYWISTSARGGFAARGGDLDVVLEGGAPLNWGSKTEGFNGGILHLGSWSADGCVDLQNDINLLGARTIWAYDNPWSTQDFARISGVIANGDATARTLARYGDGLLELTATNTYTGLTTLFGGDTRVNGTLPGAVTVAGSGLAGLVTTLSGTGSVGTLIVNAKGVVAPGTDGVGILTAVSNVTVRKGAVIDWEMGPHGVNDRLDVLGALTMEAEWVLRLRDAGGTPTADQKLPIITYAGLWASNTTYVLDGSLLDEEVWDLSQAAVFYDPTNHVVGVSGVAYTGPRVDVTDVSVLEGDSGTVEAVFGLTLVEGFMGDVDVTFTTEDGTAVAGADYIATSGVITLTFDAPTAEVRVFVQGDTTNEWPSEYFRLVLAVTENARLSRPHATGTIVDDDGARLYRMPIVFSGYEGAEPLTDFPALVLFREGWGGFSYGQMGHTNGHDLRFLNAGLDRELAYEIERWDRLGESPVWVKLPALSGTNTLIWAVWGDSAATDAPAYTTNGAVWSDNFLGVYHLDEPVGGLYRDSSPFGYHGTNEGCRVSAGAIGRAADMMGVNAIDLTGMSSVEQSYTFEVMARSASLLTRRALLDIGTPRTIIFHNEPAAGQLGFYDTAYKGLGGTTINNGEWVHLAVVADRNAGLVMGYVNGVLTGFGTYVARNLGGLIRAGSQYNSVPAINYEGQMDELRVAARPRTPDWIRASYRTQRETDVFAVPGMAETARGEDLAAGPLAVVNRPASGLVDDRATLNGLLISAGGAENPAVYVCWGETDGGTSGTGAWTFARYAGSDWGAGEPLAVDVDGLAAGTAYAYRFMIENSEGTAWAPAAEWFGMPRGRYVATAGDGSDGLSWATAYTNIQDALSAAVPGDVVYLKGERFDICDDPAGVNQLELTTSGVTVRGGYEGVGTPGDWDPETWTTVITRSAGTNRLMLVANADDVTLAAIVFTNGYARHQSAVNPVHPASSGGALFLANCQNLRIESCRFQENWGFGPNVNGGYVYGGAVCVATSRVTMVDCAIVSNRATSVSTSNLQHGSGGGVGVIEGELTLLDSLVAGNRISGDYLHGYVQGGGLGLNGGILRVARTVIAENEAGEPSNDTRQFGDGVYISGAGFLENCLLYRNGMFAPGVSGTSNFAVYVLSGYLTMNNCTVTDHKQAGIYRVGGSVRVANSIFWNNGIDIYENVAGSVSASYTLTEQGFNDGVDGCFSADPKFAETNYFHLMSTRGTYTDGYFSGGYWQNQAEDSPGIDAGDPSAAAGDEPYPNGAHLNLGAYGGTATASKSAPLAVANDPATGLSPSTARLNGRITAIGGPGTEAYFLWDTTNRADDVDAWSNRTFAGVFNLAGEVFTDLTGLTADTVYYFTLLATNPAGGSAIATPSVSFETVVSPPMVENRGVENESGPAVTLKGEVVNTGGETPDVYVLWGLLPGGQTTGSWDYAQSAGAQAGAFGVVVTTEPGRSYYYTCYAVNNQGDDWAGPPIHFGASNLLYVAADAVGMGNGQGWANAFSNLANALAVVEGGKPAEIYIQGGPGTEFQQAATAVWTQPGVRILGGFEGTGWPGARDPAQWRTVLTRRPANNIRILEIRGVTNGLLDGLTVDGGSLADFGAGLSIKDSTNLTVSNCRITRNTAQDKLGTMTAGGGLYAENSFGTLDNCLFERNAAVHSTAANALGGGLMLTNGQWLVRDSAFVYNTTRASAVGAFARGAAVYAQGGQHAFRNCLFTQNFPWGGTDTAIHSQGGALYLTNTAVTIEYCTLAGNVHEGIRFGQFAEIRNSILWHNDDDLFGTPAFLGHSSVSDGDGDGVNGCFVGDPLFEYGFYLSATSACADAASESAETAGLAGRTTRTDGSPDSGTADLGYHHATGIGPLHHLYVSPLGDDGNSGTNATAAFRSLTKALDTAILGSRISVEPDIYGTNVEVFPLILDKAGVQLLGTNAAETVLSAAGSNQRVMSVLEAPWVVLSGLTLADGYNPGYSGQSRNGAGLWIRHASDFLMEDCIVRSNQTVAGVNEYRHGGGVYAEWVSHARVRNSEFRGNLAYAASPSWNGSSYGGGFYILGGGWTFERCVFTENRGIGLNYQGTRGGAVSISGGTHEFRNTLMVSNTLQQYVFGGDGLYSENATSLVENCTIADNGWHPTVVAGFRQDGIRQVGIGAVTLRNSIVYGNATNDLTGFTTNALGELVNAHFSCIGDGQNDGVQGCTSADPLFADKTYYHLSSRGGHYTGGYFSGGEWVKAGESSPLINRGDPNSEYALEPEPNGKRINMGAYGNTETASKTSDAGGILIIIR